MKTLSIHVLKDSFASGPYCWILENPVRFQTPIPCKGKLGLFDTDYSEYIKYTD